MNKRLVNQLKAVGLFVEDFDGGFYILTEMTQPRDNRVILEDQEVVRLWNIYKGEVTQVYKYPEYYNLTDGQRHAIDKVFDEYQVVDNMGKESTYVDLVKALAKVDIYVNKDNLTLEVDTIDTNKFEVSAETIGHLTDDYSIKDYETDKLTGIQEKTLQLISKEIVIL